MYEELSVELNSERYFGIPVFDRGIYSPHYKQCALIPSRPEAFVLIGSTEIDGIQRRLVQWECTPEINALFLFLIMGGA